MSIVPKYLLTRRKDNGRRLERIRGEVTKIARGPDLARVSIYATGSYGRGESSQASDIDLFIVDAALKDETPLRRIPQIKLKAALIQMCERLGLPPFSGDARFLEVHRLYDMLDQLGGPRDDFDNLFTARMLLLLESKDLTNPNLYRQVISDIISAYFVDYEGHKKAFLPVFLVNDITRYWKTLCLNYEYYRRQRRRDGESTAEDTLQNLKLRFSRTMTCYSAVAALCAQERQAGRVDPQDVMNIVARTPTNRIQLLGEQSADLSQLANNVLEHYTWFLEQFGLPKAKTVALLAKKRNNEIAWKRAGEYRRNFAELLNAVGSKGRLLPYVMM